MRDGRLWIFAGFLWATLTFSPVCWSQAGSPAAGGRALTDAEVAGARAAASAGLTAFEAGDFAKAIDMFQRAESVVNSPVHLLYIARSLQQLGKWVEARETLMRVVRWQLPASAAPVLLQAQEQAQVELSALEPRLPYVSVFVEGTQVPADIRVMMDGQEIPRALVGIPYPVNPGEHAFQAKAQGWESDLTKGVFAEAARHSVVLKLVAVAPVPAASVPSAPGASNARPPAQAPADKDGMNPLLIGSVASFGVGAAGVVIGVVFSGKSSSAADERDARVKKECDGNRCPPSLETFVKDKDDAVTSAKSTATVGYVVGGLGVGGGVTLLVLGLNQQKAGDHAAAVRPYFGLTEMGLTGRF